MSAVNLTDVVFVYGALRSGTTVLNLMLNGHPEIHNPGEVDPLLDFLRRDPTHPTGWRYDRAAMEPHRLFKAMEIDLPPGIDGLDLMQAMLDALREKGGKRILSLTVHRHASLLAEVLPEARVVHLVRDPRDVARSCVAMGWAGNSFFGAGHWIETETDWDRAALPADQVLTVRFEDLMADPTGRLTDIATFHGAAYDPGMLAYPETTTYDPPDASACQQWRRKASPREAGLIEARIGAPLMEARGYPPEHMRPLPGPLERAQLVAGHRIGRWGFNIRRFGLPLFLGRHVAKRLRLSGLERRLNARWDEIVIAHHK